MTNQEKYEVILTKKTNTQYPELCKWEDAKAKIELLAAEEGWETGHHDVELSFAETKSGHVEYFSVFYINEPTAFDENEPIEWHVDINIV